MVELSLLLLMDNSDHFHQRGELLEKNHTECEAVQPRCGSSWLVSGASSPQVGLTSITKTNINDTFTERLKHDCKTHPAKFSHIQQEGGMYVKDKGICTLSGVPSSSARHGSIEVKYSESDTCKSDLSQNKDEVLLRNPISKSKFRMKQTNLNKTCHSVRDEALQWNRILSILFVAMFMVASTNAAFHSEPSDDMPHDGVKFWASNVGTHLSSLIASVTNFKLIQNGYTSRSATVQRINGDQLVKEMSEDVKNMMAYKLQAVRRIMNVAEESFKDFASQSSDSQEYRDVAYINAKEMNMQEMSDGAYEYPQTFPSRHFDGRKINTSMSSIHVATNVYNKSPEVLKGIKWSEKLDLIFESNYQLDPTLHWQYFGSSHGFLRQYPASAWEMDETEPDLYDARLRSWYIRAANGPKDIVILLDVSGSMTGLRKEIAKHVVLNILDTLNENDFVNVFTYSNDTKSLVNCLNDTLVQATLENIGEFKMELGKLETENIANLSLALTRAFELLAKHKANGQGTECNQAIMLITDGSPYNHEDIFHKYNWPQRQVRMFTYLIGREVADRSKLRWMACSNKGYFVHVSTLAEVREKVLKYIHVVSRPLVMYKSEHPHIWTGVYADVANPFDRQKIYTLAGRPEKVFVGRRDRTGNKSGYRLMTSVAVPVFDLNETSVKSADLLGVAGTDVPIEEIMKLIPAYKLGVNGYSFIVNQNGHVLFHPDLRPVFQDILKPNYNSVDLSEVEQPVEPGNNEARYNHSELMELRQYMINQETATAEIKVKVHLDDMKRVVVRTQEYQTAPIEGTPFSLGIALPSVNPRAAEVFGEIEISRLPATEDVTNYLKNGSWNIHPDWVYCEYKYEQPLEAAYMKTPEDLLIHFLGKVQKPGWRWSSNRTNQPPHSATKNTARQPHGEEDRKNSYFCDKELIQALLFDAEATNVFISGTGRNNFAKSHSESFYTDRGINTAFVATRSGLTRWKDASDKPPQQDGEPHYMELHNRAIDEIWYKRAVNYYVKDPEAYVYSVPFDAGTRNPNDVLVTVSRAVVIKENEFSHAPAAVVGATITLQKFIELFKNDTNKCISAACNEKQCSSDDLDCYLLDDSGFIVASEVVENTGRFFGEIEGTIMNSLVMSDVYSEVKVYDYQAVCLDGMRKGNMASILMAPVDVIKWTVGWMATNLVWVMVQTQLYQLWDPNEAWAYTQNGHVDPAAYPDAYEYDGQLRPPYPSDTVVYDQEPPATTVWLQPVVHTRPRRQVEDDAADVPENYSSVITNITHMDESLSYNLSDSEVALMDYSELFGSSEYGDDETAAYVEEVDMGTEYESEDYDTRQQDLEVEGFPKIELAYLNKTRPRPCDKEVTLYNLNVMKLSDATGNYTVMKGKLSNCHSNGCGRPFSVQKVMMTNLVLVVVNNICPCDRQVVTIEPKEKQYNHSVKCAQMTANNYRKRPSNCHSYHSEENEIKLCKGCSFPPTLALVCALLLLQVFINQRQ